MASESSPSASARCAVSLASATLLAELTVSVLLWQVRMAAFHYVITLPMLELLVSGPPGYVFGLSLAVASFVLPWRNARHSRQRHAVTTTAVQSGTASAIWLVATLALHHDSSPVRQPELTDFVRRVYSRPLVPFWHYVVVVSANAPGLRGYVFVPLGVLRRFEQRISSVRHFVLKGFVDLLLARCLSRRRRNNNNNNNNNNNMAGAKRYSYAEINEPDTIRLLMIHPTLGSTNFRGSLVQATLQSAPRYEAISYCWGDPVRIAVLLPAADRLSRGRDSSANRRNPAKHVIVIILVGEKIGAARVDNG